MSEVEELPKDVCSLMLFLATPAEEEGLKWAADSVGIPFEKINKRHSPFGEEYHWLGNIGSETVIAIRPARTSGQVVMGSIGSHGTAARAIRFMTMTGAQGIVQIGMAFGVDPEQQKLGDVLVSASILPYDNRLVKTVASGVDGCMTDYSEVKSMPARPAFIKLFQREKERGTYNFDIHFGSVLSGAARIQCRVFRDELVIGVPFVEPIIGGEMEGVGLLATSVEPSWCIVKAISDFADEQRDEVIAESRVMACRNAAQFVLNALLNDVMIQEQEEDTETIP